MRLIDADALIADIKKNSASYFADDFAHEWVNRQPTIEPERKTGCLTEDEIKAIRIHMNAFKERLCNQHRWKEAEEYQQIVDKLDVMLPRPEQRWIPCSERLPEDDVYVLISKRPNLLSGKKWCVTIAGRFKGARNNLVEWKDIGFRKLQDDEILAWMPLPEVYQEDEEE